MRIETLIDALAQAHAGHDAYNPYALGNSNNAIRRANLHIYLREMSRLEPQALLVLEAPGYRGCRLTGIPVTSRAIMMEGLGGWGVFGAEYGYHVPNDPEFEGIRREQSATILWSALRRYSVVPLVWNSFPFHPHKPGTPRSNRAPRRAEVDAGQPFIQMILELFPVSTFIAVGNVAHRSLSQMGIESVKVRHPSQGGKNDFVAGIDAVLSAF